MVRPMEKVDSTKSKSSTGSIEEDVLSFQALEASNDTDSDKDLVINSLYESLQIHKQLLERIDADKDAYIAKLENERQDSYGQDKTARLELEELRTKCSTLDDLNKELQKELHDKKEEFNRMESKFYAHLKRTRATDHDPSTVHIQIQQLLTKVFKFATMLRTSIDCKLGTETVFALWPERRIDIEQYLIRDGEVLSMGFLTTFIEKYLVDTIVHHVVQQPVHIGVSINEPFDTLETWVRNRNCVMAIKLRQMVNALIVAQENEEQENIESAKNELVSDILSQLDQFCPGLVDKTDRRQSLHTIVSLAAELSKAIKDLDQDISIGDRMVAEGQLYDSDLMVRSTKSSEAGAVFLVVTPAIILQDQSGSNRIPAKVLVVDGYSPRQSMDCDYIPELSQPQPYPVTSLH